MALTANYDSNFVQSKEGAGKGKTFHRYTITGSKEELKEYRPRKKSPAKQRVDPLDLGLLDEAKKVKVNKGLPKNFNTSGKDSWVKKSKEILKKGSTKGSTTTRFLGNKTLGLVGLLMANDAYAKTDQPKFPKGSKHYQDPKKKIDFTKTK